MLLLPLVLPRPLLQLLHPWPLPPPRLLLHFLSPRPLLLFLPPLLREPPRPAAGSAACGWRGRLVRIRLLRLTVGRSLLHAR